MENNKVIQKFNNWIKLKIEIHLNKDPYVLYFKEKQIWWASIGQNIGVESNGKNEKFERPVIIIKKFNAESFLAIVLSSKQKIGNYYFQLDKNSSFANLSQIKIMSSKRLVRKIGEVSKNDFQNIKQKIKNYL